MLTPRRKTPQRLVSLLDLIPLLISSLGQPPPGEPQGPLDGALVDDDTYSGKLGVRSRSELSRRVSHSSLLEGSLSPVTPLASDEEDEACRSNVRVL